MFISKPYQRNGFVARYLVLLLLLVIAADFGAQAQTRNQSPAKDIYSKNLEALMNMKITSVSGRKQKLSRTPAAIYVITQEDIKHSGATNIPDLLRVAPRCTLFPPGMAFSNGGTHPAQAI